MTAVENDQKQNKQCTCQFTTNEAIYLKALAKAIMPAMMVSFDENNINSVSQDKKTCQCDCNATVEQCTECSGYKIIETIETEKIIEVEKIVEVEDPIFLKLLSIIHDNEELNKCIFPHPANIYSDKLIMLISNLSQWEKILQVWDICKNDIAKNKPRLLNSDAIFILEKAIEFYNKTLHNSECKLYYPQIDTSYNYEDEDNSGDKGNTIASVSFPGLYNQGGKITKKALVKTK